MVWPLIAGPLIGGAASLIGGIMGNKSSAREAAKNRAFQADQSATQHQREVADLEAAGLNPVLSGTGGQGNSAMSGSMAQQHDVATPAVQTGTNIYNSQTQRASAKQQIEQSQAQTTVLGATARKESAAAELTELEVRRLKAHEPYFPDSAKASLGHQLEQIAASVQGRRHSEAEINKIAYDVALIAQKTLTEKEETTYRKHEATRAGFSAKMEMHKAYRSAFEHEVDKTAAGRKHTENLHSLRGEQLTRIASALDITVDEFIDRIKKGWDNLKDSNRKGKDLIQKTPKPDTGWRSSPPGPYYEGSGQSDRYRPLPITP